MSFFSHAWVSLLELIFICVLSIIAFTQFYIQYNLAYSSTLDPLHEPIDYLYHLKNSSHVNEDNIVTQSNPSQPDLHISKFSKHGSYYHFLYFLKSILPVFDPEFIFVTGDITDAKDASRLTSQQHVEEWTAYYQALKEANVLDRPQFWWDLRGNHDCFNIKYWHAETNFFKNFSRVQKSGFAFQFNFMNETYLFLGLDGCPHHGLGRPFNFFGVYDKVDLDFLERHLQGSPTPPSSFSSSSSGFQHVFLFGHYPLGTTLRMFSSEGQSFESLMTQVSVYMCGHLHRFKWNTLCPMYHAHPSGYLELELSDLKTHASYRLALIDHGRFVFRDLELPTLPPPPKLSPSSSSSSSSPLLSYTMSNLPDIRVPPILLISHPKDARFHLPHREPNISSPWPFHTPIRIFLFTRLSSPFHWNNSITCLPLSSSSSPSLSLLAGSSSSFLIPLDSPTFHPPSLYTLPWPSKIHSTFCSNFILRIQVTHLATGLQDEQQVVVNLPLISSLSPRPPPLHGGFGEWVVSMDYNKLFKVLFSVLYASLFSVILLPKLFLVSLLSSSSSTFLISSKPISKYSHSNPSLSRYAWKGIFGLRHLQRQKYTDFAFFLRFNWLRFVVLASHRFLWYPLFFMTLGFLTLPFFHGYLIHLEWGAFYLTGVSMSSSLYGHLPLLDTWFFGLSLLVTLVFPFVFYMACGCVDSKLVYLTGSRALRPYHERKRTWTLLMISFLFHLYQLTLLHQFYGAWVYASFLTLMYTGMAVFMWLAWYHPQPTWGFPLFEANLSVLEPLYVQDEKLKLKKKKNDLKQN